MKNIILDRLYNYDQYEWSLQGFGFLRLYLDDDRVYRLHVWDDRYRVEGVSDIHNHPWSFTSQIIAGSLTNHLYHEQNTLDQFNTTIKQRILTGENAKPSAPPENTHLIRYSNTTYVQGSIYHQRADEIHRTYPSRGAITLIKREFEQDRDHADVYFPTGQEWVDAAPRRATKEEVKDIMENAISKLFGNL